MSGHLKPDHLLNVNPNNFITPTTIEAAYILGFLWSDGYLPPNQTFRISLEIVTEDANDILPIFLKTGSWKPYTRQPPNRKQQTNILTHTKKLYDFLIKNDYKQKSLYSPTKILSVIPPNLHYAFWHGIFDGDGCLYMNHANRQYQIKICGSFNQDWRDLELLCSSLGIRYSICRDINKNGTGSTVRFCSKSAISAFLKYIYQDNTIGLTRKYLKAQDFLTNVQSS